MLFNYVKEEKKDEQKRIWNKGAKKISFTAYPLKQVILTSPKKISDKQDN